MESQGKGIVLKRKLKPGNLITISLVHLVAGFALWYAAMYGFTPGNWLLFAGLFFLGGLGVTVGYHRMMTHRSFHCGRILHFILSVCGAMAAEGSESEWVANHRVHHYFADQEYDPHSPRAYPGIKGFLWAHVFWLFFVYERPLQYRRFRDLDLDPIVQWQQRFYLPLVLLGFIIPFLAFGWKGLLLSGFLRLAFLWNVSWSVNSICHLFGSRAKDSEDRLYKADDSRNNIFIALLGFGEGYHANHHARPAWAYHGWKWYSLDLSKWLIRFLELAGLVWGVKKPTRLVSFQENTLKKTA